MSPQQPVKAIFGTYRIGDSTNDILVKWDDEKDVSGILDALYDRGYTELDTARDYPNINYGSTEERLGLVNAASRFTIHTKVSSHAEGSHSAENIAASIDKSLAALKVTQVETMFLHVPRRETPFEETAKAMNEAFKQGKFKYFGLSNYPASDVQKFIDICDKNGFVRPSVFQGHYNAVVRGAEEELIPLLRKYNIPFYGFSPAAGGLFKKDSAQADRWNPSTPIGRGYTTVYGQDIREDAVVRTQAAVEKYNITSHGAALRWVAFHSALDGKYGDGLVFSVSSNEQLQETLDFLEAGPLPDEVAQAISEFSAAYGDKAPVHHF